MQIVDWRTCDYLGKINDTKPYVQAKTGNGELNAESGRAVVLLRPRWRLIAKQPGFIDKKAVAVQ